MGHTAQKGQVACLHLQVTKALKLRPEKCKATNQGKEWEFEVLRELYMQRPKGDRQSAWRTPRLQAIWNTDAVTIVWTMARARLLFALSNREGKKSNNNIQHFLEAY